MVLVLLHSIMQDSWELIVNDNRNPVELLGQTLVFLYIDDVNAMAPTKKINMMTTNYCIVKDILLMSGSII